MQEHALKLFLCIVLQGENNYDRREVQKNEVQNNMQLLFLCLLDALFKYIYMLAVKVPPLQHLDHQRQSSED